MNEAVFIIRPRNDYLKYCEDVRRKYFEFLSKGVQRFKFLVVTDEPLHRWIESIKCVLEVNISASIVVNQIRPEELSRYVSSKDNVVEI